MVLREIVKIDEEKCNGCGLCIPNCPEGALQIIDRKARLVSDLRCDGLGACIGHCPEDAITVEKREAEAYDEKKVMEDIIKLGDNTIRAHLEHLKEHGETEFLKIAISVLEEKGIEVPIMKEEKKGFYGCPGSAMKDFSDKEIIEEEGKRSSQLRQWPLQLHLVPPTAPFFQDKDVLLSADCVSHALADFHKDYLKGKGLAIACPKLDSDQEIYKEKIMSMIDDAKINTLTVMIMEVPCCAGLLYMAKQAAEEATRKIPIKAITVSVQGEIKSEEWV